MVAQMAALQHFRARTNTSQRAEHEENTKDDQVSIGIAFLAAAAMQLSGSGRPPVGDPHARLVAERRSKREAGAESRLLRRG